jgi:hypothetical protein
MDATQPGLFDLPDREPPAGAKRRAARGRNRETWVRTATAEVTIVDRAAVLHAAARAEGVATVIGFDAAGEDDTEPQTPQPGAANDALDALAWLIWPTDGLDELLEAGAFRILSIESEVSAGTADRGTATWSATVKLTDVDELRRLATQAHPENAALVSDSLELAWQHAADPFVPLRSIPGITWSPRSVHVEHLRAGAAKDR